MTGEITERSAWETAVLAARVFAVDPLGLGGLSLRARFGPARERWFEEFRSLFAEETVFRKLPPHASEERIFGGLDLTTTLARGKPAAERGLLAGLEGGILVISSCERLEPGLASRIGLALDSGVVESAHGFGIQSARFGVVAFDEGISDDERPPASLLERVGVQVAFEGRPPALDRTARTGQIPVAVARTILNSVEVPDGMIASLCAASVALGIASLRAPLLALRAARASAALHGRATASEEDAALAAVLVLAPRATRIPQDDRADRAPKENTPESKDQNRSPEAEGQSESAPTDQELTDLILASAKASLPERLLAGDKCATPAPANAAGPRPAGVRRGEPKSGVKVNLIETLRASAPWQPLRRRTEAGAATKIEVRREDFRVKRLKSRSQTLTIFAVDASGSTALQRLSEAKGAIELLLAECYIRRDQVALVSFRGKSADLLLPPTRSLTRAKRSLSALPGGGGTPLAAGIDAAGALALASRRKGISPAVVFLTDGRANVARDGQGGRDRAQKDAGEAALRLRLQGVSAMLIDTSQRPQPLAEKLAADMAAQYVPLPYANAAAISKAAQRIMKP
jgi:magnesium chelatase subunit D